MRQTSLILLGALSLVACGGGSPAQSAAEITNKDAPVEATDHATIADHEGEASADNAPSDSANTEPGTSAIQPTETEAAMRFFVVDKEKGPIEGIVISLTDPDGKKFYTKETDKNGYAELLVPVGKKYDVVYLSLGRKDITASLPVPNEANLNFKFTLRYKRFNLKRAPGQTVDPGFVLKGVMFDTAKATIRPESLDKLDSVLEYMTHKKNVRIQIAGHSDNVGKAKSNKDLSERRAEACRQHLISKGIDGSRLEAIGYGDEQPVAPNDTKEGRQKNRRIEAKEL